MWTHFCSVDQAKISVGDGEQCNWCGLMQPHAWKKHWRQNKNLPLGRTIEQLMEAPQGGTFVWHSADVRLVKRMALFAGRPDLTIIGGDEFINLMKRNSGDRSKYVVDHYAASRINSLLLEWERRHHVKYREFLERVYYPISRTSS